MNLTDDNVRENVTCLISAFASNADEVAKRPGFHLYCLEVAMGFKYIYQKIFNTPPPGMSAMNLQQRCVNASSLITVSEISQYKLGQLFHNDVYEVLRYFETTKNITKVELADAQKRTLVAELQVTNTNLALKREKLASRRFVESKVKAYESEKNSAVLAVEAKMELQRQSFQSQLETSAVRVAEAEKDADIAKEAVNLLKAEIQTLKNFSALAARIEAIQTSLETTKTRLELGDFKLMESIQRLLSGPMDRATAEELRKLVPLSSSGAITSVDPTAKNSEIASLKVDLAAQTELVKAKELELEGAKKQIETITRESGTHKSEKNASEEELNLLRSECKKLGTFLTTFCNFNQSFKLTTSPYDTASLKTHIQSIDDEMCSCLDPAEWVNIKTVLKYSLINFIALYVYNYFKKLAKFDIFPAQQKNVQELSDIFPAHSEMIHAVSAASYGFQSLSQTLECHTMMLQTCGYVYGNGSSVTGKSIKYKQDKKKFSVFAMHTQSSANNDTLAVSMDMVSLACNQYLLLRHLTRFMINWLNLLNKDSTVRNVIQYMSDCITVVEVSAVDTSQSMEFLELLKDTPPAQMLASFSVSLLAQALDSVVPTTQHVIKKKKVDFTVLTSIARKLLAKLRQETVTFDVGERENMIYLQLDPDLLDPQQVSAATTRGGAGAPSTSGP